MFECDAKLSADGVPFLMHDATLDRTTNGRGIGGAQPWSALSQLDAGGWHSRAFAGEPLPTLENLARFCLANDYLLNIEIKPTPGTERETGEVVAREAARLWQARRFRRCSRRSRSSRCAGAPPCSPSCRAACCSTRSATAGSRRRSTSAAWPSSATTRCGMPPPSRRCTAPACAR
jgi:hypothetical protein